MRSVVSGLYGSLFEHDQGSVWCSSLSLVLIVSPNLLHGCLYAPFPLSSTLILPPLPPSSSFILPSSLFSFSFWLPPTSNSNSRNFPYSPGGERESTEVPSIYCNPDRASILASHENHSTSWKVESLATTSRD